MKKISRRNFLPVLGTAFFLPRVLSNASVEDIPEKSLPKRLKPGDTIGICSSAGAVWDSKDLYECVQFLKTKGYKVLVGPNAKGNQGYFSAEDKKRADEFMQMIIDPTIDAIFFSRGGWGAARMLEFLDFEQIKANPKIIMGFSDITTLLFAITKRTGLITFHGPNANSTWNSFSWSSLDEILVQGLTPQYTLNIKQEDILPKTIVPGIATGELIGGNLTVLCSSIGTVYEPEWQGKILFLEEVKEEPYRIDRMLTQLKHHGVFDKINGLVLGQFRKCIPEEPHHSFTLEEVIYQHFIAVNFPVYFGAPFGHTKLKITIPIGIKATLDASQGTLSYQEKSVV